MAGVLINNSVKTGWKCIIKISSSFNYDVVIGDYAYISLSSRIAEYVDIHIEVGIESFVSNDLPLCIVYKNGTGAIVVNNIYDG